MCQRPSHAEVAYERWERRSRPYWDQDKDSYYAAVVLKLRPYLAQEATRNPAEVANILAKAAQVQGIPIADSVTLIAIGDGGPEYRDARIEDAIAISLNNGQHPDRVIEAKDATFYEICYYTLRLYGGNVLEDPDAPPGDPARRRPYQDACVGMFTGDKPVDTAVKAALHLAREMKTYNDEHPVSWSDRVHARSVIGGTLQDALAGVKSAWRDEIVVSRGILEGLPHDYCSLLFSAGIQVGPPQVAAPSRTQEALAHASRP